MNNVKTIGIIGMGSMGQLIARYACRWAKVIFADPNVEQSQYATKADLAEVCSAQIVFVVVPVSVYDQLLPQVADKLDPESVLVEVASVKLFPQKKLNEHLSGHKHILLSHPLFGPESAAESLENKLFIVCSATGKANQLCSFLDNNLNLKLVYKTADEHDKAMAYVQGLTFYLAHGLRRQHLIDTDLLTPSYRWIEGLQELDKSHSEDLLRTILSYNPHAQSIRAEFLANLEDIDQQFKL